MPNCQKGRYDNPATDHRRRRRLREVSQYYCTASPDGIQEDGEVIFGTSLGTNNSSGIEWTPRRATLSADPVLTSLAQATALRLGVERCLVSIIDNQYQHVVAEATRSISPFDIDQHNKGDEIMLGAQPLPINWGVCSTILSTFVDDMPIPLSQPGNISSPSGVLISDLIAENRSCFVPVVLQNRQRLRFYAGVPLLSDAGHCLGVVCVFDPVPRAAQKIDLENLRISARVISRYLSSMRLQLDNARAQRLLNGMANFLHPRDETHVPLAVSSMSESDGRSYLHSEPSSSVLSASPPLCSDLKTSPHYRWPAAELVDQNARPNGQPSPGVVPPESCKGDLAENGASPGHSFNRREDTDKDPVARDILTGFDHTFARASNLIRQSLELDGTCFLEISQKQKLYMDKLAATAELSDPPDQSASSGARIETDSPGNDALSSGEPSWAFDTSHCLAYSDAHNDNVHDREPSVKFVLPTKLLVKLACLYPKGHVFHFDRFGGVTSDEDDSNLVTRKHRTARLAEQLFNHFKSIPSLIFLPLYDNIGQNAYAGFLGWTTDPKRSLHERDLTYVSGFANSIMSHFMRRQLLEVDKIKSDFISSISHELRSPLHGVLAANQLLLESPMSREQEELTKTVQNCAVTLLDVLNQLLNYAKITSFKGPRKAQRRHSMEKGAKALHADHLPSTQLSLASLLQSTTSSFVSHALYLGSPIAELDLSLSDDGGRSTISNTSPFIIIDLDFTTVQQCLSHSGLWRTIVLNLLGNAIKYTDGGHVNATLKLHKASRKSADVRIAELCISDTGQGMSEYFLQHRCFEPYTQVDSLSAGTGVGLSIVQRAVDLLDGSIRIDSKLGQGTKVVVKIPVTMVPQPALDDSRTGTVFSGLDLSILRNIKFHLPKFSDMDEDIPLVVEASRDRKARWQAIRAALTSTMKGWCGMQETTLEDADLVFVEQQAFQKQTKKYDIAGIDLVIIVGGLKPSRSESDFGEKIFANFTTLHSPLGPEAIIMALQTLRDQKISRPTAERGEPAIAPGRPLLHRSRASHAQGSKQNLPNSSTFPILRSQSPRDPQLERKLVLLVDDNDLNLRVLKIMVEKLKIHDLEAITASDGQQALNSFVGAIDQGRNVPFIFMDITMPVMDGMEATRRIRKYETSKGVLKDYRAYIVAVTGLVSIKDRRDILASGVDTYIPKPANLNALRQVLLDRKAGPYAQIGGN